MNGFDESKNLVVQIAKLEERLASMVDRFIEEIGKNQEQTKAIWVKIDKVAEKLVSIETIVQNAEIGKITNNLSTISNDINLLKAWKESIWRFSQPAVSAVCGGVIAYVIEHVISR
jgi:aspartyl-tRNA synthetase